MSFPFSLYYIMFALENQTEPDEKKGVSGFNAGFNVFTVLKLTPASRMPEKHLQYEETVLLYGNHFTFFSSIR